jgi:hypothetical protein
MQPRFIPVITSLQPVYTVASGGYHLRTLRRALHLPLLTFVAQGSDLREIVPFPTSYPDHYSLIFLVRHPNPEVLADRERLGREFLADIDPIVQVLMPHETPATVVDMRLREMLTCLHGTAALLIAHPKAYGLTKQKAIHDVESTFQSLLGHTLSTGRVLSLDRHKGSPAGKTRQSHQWIPRAFPSDISLLRVPSRCVRRSSQPSSDRRYG